MKHKEETETIILGSPVSEGIAMGPAFILKPIQEEVPNFPIKVNQVDEEVSRYRKALFSSREDLEVLRRDLEMECGTDEAVRTIETHIQMLDDPLITTDVEGQIRHMLKNTESVFQSVISTYKNRFTERTDDSFFQKRLVDVQDLSDRILGNLLQRQHAQLSEVPLGSIIFTNEIAPSYAAAAHATQIGGFVTQRGGGNSHAALICRSKGIPFVVINDLEETLLNETFVIIDGYEGKVIFNPTDETRAHYEAQQKLLATRYQRFLDEDHLKPITRDGFEVKLNVNVGNPSDLDTYPYCHDGIGLFRTEYLFLQSDEYYPSEKYQETAYRTLIEKAQGKPVVIRVFDLGGDKHPRFFVERHVEPNPVLGNRGIRFLLKNRDLFRSQLRAIFKASFDADVKILLPLISDINELHTSIEIINEVKDDLRKRQIPIKDLPIGCMIEVPAAVLMLDAFAKHCQFLSMGTNDLVQYTLGVDRSNPLMSELYYPAHPSVLRMIKMITVEAKRRDIPVTICGEIASNKLFTPLLMGLGLESFSIAPRYIPYVKEVVRKWTIVEAYKLAEDVLKLSDPKEIIKILTEIDNKGRL